jgi:hypothetical protein
MAKVRLAKGKQKKATSREGWGCILMVAFTILVAILFLIWVLSNANPS